MEFEQAALMWAQRQWSDAQGVVFFHIDSWGVLEAHYRTAEGFLHKRTVRDSVDDIMREIVTIAQEEPAKPCSCGDPSISNVNHRKTIPCWTYIGYTRYHINALGKFERAEEQ